MLFRYDTKMVNIIYILSCILQCKDSRKVVLKHMFGYLCVVFNRIFIKQEYMNWLNELLWGQGIGHSILLLSFVIALGIQLGKIKVFGISLGITLVLFVGIVMGQLGFTMNHEVIHFFKEFGLILFVFSVGMQVGPSFFSSFKKGGITLNLLACGIVFLGVITAIIIHYVTGIPMATMVGILSGAE